MEKIYCFFLGGMDAEMVRIREVLDNVPTLGDHVSTYRDENLGWGAKASAYGDKIRKVAEERGWIPVLVELEVDCEVPEGTIVIDHHGDRAAEPASILQVLSLLKIKPTRWDQLIAANDAAWFPGLQAMGATTEEMAKVRAADREAQGITPEQEAEAERALAAVPEFIGDIRVIRMSHSKTAPIGDRLAISAIAASEPIPDYVVFSDDGEVNFSGAGDLAAALHSQFPDGWAGGAGLGKADGTAYWGGYPPHEAVEAFLHRRR